MKIPNKWKSNGIQDIDDPTQQSEEESWYDSCVPGLKEQILIVRNWRMEGSRKKVFKEQNKGTNTYPIHVIKPKTQLKSKF